MQLKKVGCKLSCHTEMIECFTQPLPSQALMWKQKKKTKKQWTVSQWMMVSIALAYKTAS